MQSLRTHSRILAAISYGLALTALAGPLDETPADAARTSAALLPSLAQGTAAPSPECASSSPSPANEKPTAKSPTYSAILQDPVRNAELVQDFGPACAAFIAKIYRSGGTLRSRTVARATRPANFTTAYHWTDFKDFPTDLADEFSFLRTRRLSRQAGALGASQPVDARVFYVASNAESSRSFGSILHRFRISPQARLINLRDIRVDRVIRELEHRYPGLDQACPRSSEGSTHMTRDREGRVFLPLYLVLEESGVDLVDYCFDQKGGNRRSSWAVLSSGFREKGWYQVIRPNALEPLPAR